MKLTYLKSSTCIIENNGIKVLFDPWLTNGEYYGSWNHLSVKDIDDKIYKNLDYIYISHIHPDHFSKKTLKKFDKSTKVLIHKFAKPFLKKSIEANFFNVIEIEHGKKFFFDKEFFIKIYAADDCNPLICSKHFACEISKNQLGSNQIDTLCLISNYKKNILNVNDCPFEMSKTVLKKIIKKYNKIDLLLAGYAGAGPYPQCFSNLNKSSKIKKSKIKKIQFLNQASNFAKLINPKYFMPFAGTYYLGGKLTKLNKFRGVATRLEAKKFLSSRHKNIKFFILKTNGEIDLDSNILYKEENQENENLDAKKIKFLNSKNLDYDKIKFPNENKLSKLLEKAYERFMDKIILTGYNKGTKVIVQLSSNRNFIIDTKQKKYFFSKKNIFKKNYLLLKVDKRLLYKILQGPMYAHWNNADIGSHIDYYRKPDIYEKKLFYCLNFFHA